MGRYRPPQPPSSPYITPEGKERLQNELKAIWKRRAEVTKALAAAAAEGDRSENAEYIYRKKELGGIDRRIRYLQKRLPDLKVVSEPPSDPSRIFFGAWVRLENEEGEKFTYRIIGADEFDLEKGFISMDSPMAKVLIKKSVGDELEVQVPAGKVIYYVLEVSYQPIEN